MISPVASTTATDPIRNGRLHDAAQKFEAIMLGELLKPMQKGFSGADEDSEPDTLASYGTEALAEGMVRAGGIGIAASIEKRLSVHQGNSVSAPKVPHRVAD